MKLYEFVDKLYEMGDMDSPKTIESKKTLNESLNEDIQIHFPEYDYTPEDIKKAVLAAINETGIPESEVVAVTYQPDNGYEYDHFYIDFANGDEEDISGQYIQDIEDLAYSFAEAFTEYIEDNLTEEDEDDLDEGVLGGLAGSAIQNALNDAEDDLEEELTEAVNPENAEVNAIIAKHLGKKSKISNKEQEVLDKYGISRNKYGDFVGPNGKELRSLGRKTVQGPEVPVSKFGSRGRQHWDWSANANFRSGKKDSFDAVDYANYLTKETPGEGEYPATNDNYYNRQKSSSKWDNEYPSTPSEDAALRPYSDKYQELKANVEDKKYDVENASGWRKPLTDEEIEAKIAEYRDQLMRDQKRYQDWAESDKQAYDDAKQELDDFKASVPKRNK